MRCKLNQLCSPFLEGFCSSASRFAHENPLATVDLIQAETGALHD